MPPLLPRPLRLSRIATCVGGRSELATWWQMSHMVLLPPAVSSFRPLIRRSFFSPPAAVPSAPIRPPSPLPPSTQPSPSPTSPLRSASFPAGAIKRVEDVSIGGRRNGGSGCCGRRVLRCAAGEGRGKGGGRGGAETGFDEWMRRVADGGGGDVALAPLARRDGGTAGELGKKGGEGLARGDGASAGRVARGDSARARPGEGGGDSNSNARRRSDRGGTGGDNGGANDDVRGGEGAMGQSEGMADWMGAESSGFSESGGAGGEGEGGEESWGREGGGEGGEGGEGVRWFEWRECVDVLRAQMEGRQLQWNERRRRFEDACTGSEIDGAAASGGSGSGGGGGNGSVFFLAPPLVLLPPTAPQSPQEYIRYLLSRPTLSAPPASPPPPSASPRAPSLALGSHMVALLCADSAALAIFHQGRLAQHKVSACASCPGKSSIRLWLPCSLHAPHHPLLAPRSFLSPLSRLSTPFSCPPPAPPHPSQVITAYTVRAKQGRSQLAQQRGKGAGRMSAGAAIRARETRRLFSEVVQRCVAWEADIRQCERLYFSGDVRAWNEVRCAWNEVWCAWNEVWCTWDEVRCTWNEVRYTWNEVRCGWNEVRCGWNEVRCRWNEVRPCHVPSHPTPPHAPPHPAIPITPHHFPPCPTVPHHAVQVYACRAPAMPVERKDERWVKVPFHVARPRLSQVLQ
ncbi:unnamed protein product [Closterium sp. Naga37s-1]|nr:unnamed protein product [Closterium sp. Naga37s-1]